MLCPSPSFLIIFVLHLSFTLHDVLISCLFRIVPIPRASWTGFLELCFASFGTFVDVCGVRHGGGNGFAPVAGEA